MHEGIVDTMRGDRVATHRGWMQGAITRALASNALSAITICARRIGRQHIGALQGAGLARCQVKRGGVAQCID